MGRKKTWTKAIPVTKATRATNHNQIKVQVRPASGLAQPCSLNALTTSPDKTVNPAKTTGMMT
jgi:hypothetical protein